MDLNFSKQIYELLERYEDQKKYEKEGEYNFVNESDLDSFELLNFIADVEELFKVNFSPEELSNSEKNSGINP